MTKWQYAEVYYHDRHVIISSASAEGRDYKSIPIDRKDNPDDALWRCVGAMGNEGWEPFQSASFGENQRFYLKRSY